MRVDETIVCRARIRIVAYITALTWMGIMMMPGRFTGLLSTELALTNKRLIGRIGMFRRRSLLLAHKDIELASARRGLLGFFFNYGSVIINDTNGNRTIFRGIIHPMEVAEQINEYSEIAILGRSLPRMETPVATKATVSAQPAQPKPEPKIVSSPVKPDRITPSMPVYAPAIVQQTDDVQAASRLHYKDPNTW